jgi:hypothetical protein
MEPASPTTDAMAVAAADDGAETVPFRLEGPAAAEWERPRLGEHRLCQPHAAPGSPALPAGARESRAQLRLGDCCQSV